MVTGPSQHKRSRWRRRFGSLAVKLFLAIAGANVVLVMAAYLIYGWSFDRGLVEYLNQADEARLTPLIARLADGYREHGNWRWLSEDRQRWQYLLHEELGTRPPRRGDDHEPPRSAQAAPAPTPPITIDPRMLLLDARREVLVGPPDRLDEAVVKPIVVDGATVGHLAYVPRLHVVASLERVFLSQQNRRFAAIALGLLAAVLLNAALISHWLSRRLRALRAGATALARGDYGTRIPVGSHDELDELAADFNQLAEALAAAQRARQQWIADIAHELRTPLTALRAEIEALEDGVRPLSRAGVASLAQEVGQLTRLVEDLRLLSLSDLGALDYRKEPLLLDELIDDSLAAARRAIDEHGLAVSLELQPGLRVLADGERLAQVCANLLQNTLRYSEAPARLQIALRAEGGDARLVWQDSAPGVPDAELPRLTERLYRVDGSRTRASGGSGLGLAIAKAIVEAHGGRMRASASSLGGLRWDLWLPLHTRQADQHG